MKRFHVRLHVDDLAKWMLADLKARAEAADMAWLDADAATCCDARSDKHWITDTQGIAWEHFRTLGNIPVFSEGASVDAASACRTPTPHGKPISIAVKASDSCC